MKVSLDENLLHKLLKALTGPDVATVLCMGWSGLTNGRLLVVAEESGIDVLVTSDRSLHYQQNLSGRRIAIVTLSAPRWPLIRENLPKVQSAVDGAVPGSFTAVECGTFSRL